MSFPRAAAIAAEGDSVLYVTEASASGRIFKITQGGAWLGSWGAGVGGAAQLAGYEHDIAVDAFRNVYTIDEGGPRIAKFSYAQPTQAKRESWGKLKKRYQ